jgi:hypothetical protein
LKCFFIKIKALQSIKKIKFKTMNSVTPPEIVAFIRANEPNNRNAVRVLLSEINRARVDLSLDQIIVLRAHLEELLIMVLPANQRRYIQAIIRAPVPRPAVPVVVAPVVAVRPAAPVVAAPVPPQIPANEIYNPVNKVKAISRKKMNDATPDICLICHDKHNMSSVATVDCCGQHIGHDCLKGWLQTNQRSPSCPCCRKSMPTFVTYRAFNIKNSPKTPAPKKPAGNPFARYDYIDFVLETFD